jgi:hypothetical protein
MNSLPQDKIVSWKTGPCVEPRSNVYIYIPTSSSHPWEQRPHASSEQSVTRSPMHPCSPMNKMLIREMLVRSPMVYPDRFPVPTIHRQYHVTLSRCQSRNTSLLASHPGSGRSSFSPVHLHFVRFVQDPDCNGELVLQTTRLNSKVLADVDESEFDCFQHDFYPLTSHLSSSTKITEMHSEQEEALANSTWTFGIC